MKRNLAAITIALALLSAIVIPADALDRCSFIDTNSDSMRDSIEWCYKNGLMKGVGRGRFNPKGKSSRAMAVTALYRASQKKWKNESTFIDVLYPSWYSEAVNWAEENKIIKGTSNGLFSPNDPITRQDIAVLLYRYAGEPFIVQEKNCKWLDIEDVSMYARTAVCWAYNENLLESENYIYPKREVSRAQLARLMRYYFDEGKQLFQIEAETVVGISIRRSNGQWKCLTELGKIQDLVNELNDFSFIEIYHPDKISYGGWEFFLDIMTENLEWDGKRITIISDHVLSIEENNSIKYFRSKTPRSGLLNLCEKFVAN